MFNYWSHCLVTLQFQVPIINNVIDIKDQGVGSREGCWERYGAVSANIPSEYDVVFVVGKANHAPFTP